MWNPTAHRVASVSLACIFSTQSSLGSLAQATTATRFQQQAPKPLRFPLHRRSCSNLTKAMAGSQFQYPDPIVYPAPAAHTATVFFLHGLGDSGDGWSDVAPQLSSALPHVKFVFPNAPLRPISLNGGMRMPGWYDIYSLDGINRQEDDAGLQESFRYMEALIQAEASEGIQSDRIVMGGFSQGGAVACMMLRSDLQLAAVVGLSTYMPLATEPPIVSQANARTPIFLGHGDADQVVRYEFGKETLEELQAVNANVEFKTYRGMGHSAVPEELRDLQQFLQRAIP
ncbi:hypothetical protein WJX72_009810 [[Myrmecia] bisecta]|uniref:palmitoyl-protein hydrolase n=1 Tax=[Myrmecia] bisecta TaxID=41462 RepID=A0AAW1Q113_9CHLO